MSQVQSLLENSVSERVSMTWQLANIPMLDVEENLDFIPIFVSDLLSIPQEDLEFFFQRFNIEFSDITKRKMYSLFDVYNSPIELDDNCIQINDESFFKYGFSITLIWKQRMNILRSGTNSGRLTLNLATSRRSL